MANNFCPKCGKPLKPDTKFCGNCGAKIENDTTTTDEIVQNSSISDESKITDEVVQNASIADEVKTAEPTKPIYTEPPKSTSDKLDNKYSLSAFSEKQIKVTSPIETNSVHDTEEQNISEEQPKSSLNKDELISQIKEQFFNSKGRINRKIYIQRTLLLYALSLISLALTSTGILAIIGIPAIIATTVSHAFLAVQRFHDIDKTGTCIILLFIPYINILVGLYLWIAKGTTGDNKYGSDPLQTIEA